MIQGVEFHLADATREFTRRRERARRERGNDGDVHHIHVAALRDHVAAAIDHNGQLGLGLFQKIAEHAVQRRYVFNRQDRDGAHAGSFCDLEPGSSGIATGSGAPCGASLCLLNLCNRICETAFNAAKTFWPLLEITSKLCSRFFRLLSTYSM